MADVTFKNTYKIYDKKVEAVKNLSFECKDGEFFAILGPSGCGKTSTLRMLAGLEDISKGDIYIGGRQVTHVPSNQRNVAMSFENYGLYPHMTVFENIAYPLRIRDFPEQQLEQQVMDMVRKLHLLDTLDSYPFSLSSGQKQRVSIARALVRNPDVTIMDEPLSHLDARMRSYMRGEIRHLHNSLDLTTIYVTHDQMEAMTMADKVLIMDFGVKQQIGTPDEVYNEPANLFVAGFIGSPHMNFIQGTLRQENGEVYFVFEPLLRLNVSHYSDQLVHGQPVTLGVRPHDIEISRSEKENYFKGSVYIIEPLGETTIFNIRFGNDVILRAELDGSYDEWNMQDDIWFNFDMSRIHLFNNKTDKRITR